MESVGVAAPRTARQRVRIELTGEIKEAARRRLASDGAPALSLRAVARDVGMVSSAVYRYFPSRDALLTALIVDAYDGLGEAAERAEKAVRRADFAGRWRAICTGVRLSFSIAMSVASRPEICLRICYFFCRFTDPKRPRVAAVRVQKREPAVLQSTVNYLTPLELNAISFAAM